MKNPRPWHFLAVLLLSFSFHTIPSLAADVISASQTLSGDQTIISSGDVFELGFFKPGNSSNYYIGIWYKKVSQQTIVWVANRDTPVSNKNLAKLVISNGNLVLLNESQIIVWSTNLTSTTSSDSVVAVLLDSGNLVLREKLGSLKNLWQSFDYPTDTFLPGGKIKLNKNTKQPQYLTSWKNTEDPATGLFSLELDPQGSNSFLIQWNKSEQYWTSGIWNGQTFSLVPEMRLNYIFNFSFVSNENESYFTYSLYNSSILSRLVMSISGQIQQLTWLQSTQQWNLFWSQPRQQCEVYAICGAFGSCNENSLPSCSCLTRFQPKSQTDWDLGDNSGGCVREIMLQCENPSSLDKERDGFLRVANVSLPINALSVAVGNAGECESTCLNNCNCSAYAYDMNRCLIWYGDVINLQQISQDDSNGVTLFLKVAASESPNDKHQKQEIIGIVVGLVGGIGVLLAVSFFVMMRMKRRRFGLGRTVMSSSMAFKHCGQIINIVVRIIGALGALFAFLVFVFRRRIVRKGRSVDGSLMAFDYRDLQIATNNFSEKLEGGGFSSVYKGTLPDSSVIAVKKIESISQGEKQFRSEVSSIGKIQHVNLVPLRGFCYEGNKKLLVYDYMPNGSLDEHLFQQENSKRLEWKLRYQIALATARGLNYLHDKCKDCIIHCDIKPENILLDSDFCPKIADFGLTKLVGMEMNRILTTMRGTRGYLAPEWISGVAITPKVDVYSFGMMLFELVSGRRNFEPSKDGRVKFFPTWAANVVIQGGDVLELLDPMLEGNADIEEVTRMIKLASWCVQDEESNRPSMCQIVPILEGFLDMNLPPIPRSLLLFVGS